MTGPATPQAGLRRLLDQATPGPWCVNRVPDSGDDVRAPDGGIVAWPEGCYLPEKESANLRLIALAPEMAALLCDMATELRRMMPTAGAAGGPVDRIPPLLARFRALEKKAGQP